MKRLADRPTISLTLRQLMDYSRHHQQEVDFFNRSLKSSEEERANAKAAQEWLVCFLKKNDPSKLSSRKLNFVIFHVYVHTDGWGNPLVKDYGHASWDGLKVHLLQAVKLGAYPWES